MDSHLLIPYIDLEVSSFEYIDSEVLFSLNISRKNLNDNENYQIKLKTVSLIDKNTRKTISDICRLLPENIFIDNIEKRIEGHFEGKITNLQDFIFMISLDFIGISQNIKLFYESSIGHNTLELIKIENSIKDTHISGEINLPVHTRLSDNSALQRSDDAQMQREIHDAYQRIRIISDENQVYKNKLERSERDYSICKEELDSRNKEYEKIKKVLEKAEKKNKKLMSDNAKLQKKLEDLTSNQSN